MAVSDDRAMSAPLCRPLFVGSAALLRNPQDRTPSLCPTCSAYPIHRAGPSLLYGGGSPFRPSLPYGASYTSLCPTSPYSISALRRSRSEAVLRCRAAVSSERRGEPQ